VGGEQNRTSEVEPASLTASEKKLSHNCEEQEQAAERNPRGGPDYLVIRKYISNVVLLTSEL
jgi:hypothetical protein